MHLLQQQFSAIVHYNIHCILSFVSEYDVMCKHLILTALPGPASLVLRPLPDFTRNIFFFSFVFEIKFGHGLRMRLCILLLVYMSRAMV